MSKLTTIRIPEYRIIKLNSYHPLCENELGNKAISTYGYPPFIDASCRREPDFQNPYPSISALCRQGSFAPHLRNKDIVVYMTKSGNYQPYNQPHHRLVAILQVEEVYSSHQAGKQAYSALNVDIPSNCMVEGNSPYDFDHTAGLIMSRKELKTFITEPESKQQRKGKSIVSAWDKSYFEKSQRWTSFVRTKPLYLNVNDPKPIFRSDFDTIFGKLPNTRSPKKISPQQLRELGRIAGVDILIN